MAVQMDRQAINLAKAIRQHESGENYEAQGKSGENGAYQFMPTTWKSWAKEVLGDENAPMTRENQNAVAYVKIKKWKDQGYNAGQIASIWNSGSPEWENKVGTNKYGVAYNVPGYVKDVTDLYHQYKTESGDDSNSQLERIQVNTQPVPQEVTQTAEKGKGLLNAASDFFAGSTKSFGNTLGQAVANITGTGEEIEKANQTYMDTGNKMVQAAKNTTDPAKREKYLKLANNYFKQAGSTYQAVLPAVEKTNKQILGEVLGTGLEAMGGGVFKGAKAGISASKIAARDAATMGSKTGLMGKIINQAKEGAKIGGAYGTAYGISKGMQENKDIGGIAGEAALGGGTGLIAGGALGIVGNAIKSAKSKNALESITLKPNEISPTEYENLVKLGKIDPKTRKIVITPQQKALAEKYSDLIGSKNPLENADKVLKEIERQDDELGKYLTSNNISIDKNELRAYLEKNIKNIDDIYARSESSVERTRQAAIESLLKEIKEDTLRDVWTGRKSFDKIIDKKINAFSGSETFRKELAKAVRNGAQDFITEKLGNTVYGNRMLNMRELYELLDPIATKATRQRGSTGMNILKKNHPKFRWLLDNTWKATKIAAGGTIGGIGLNYGSSLLSKPKSNE